MPWLPFSRRGAALAVDFALAGALFLPTALLTLRGLLAFGVLLADHDYHAELNFFDNWYSLAWLVLFFGLSNHVGNGQTLGKKLFGLRSRFCLVHQRLGVARIERALAYGASALELGFGFLQHFLHPNRQTVHDRIAETIVTDERLPAIRLSDAGCFSVAI